MHLQANISSSPLEESKENEKINEIQNWNQENKKKEALSFKNKGNEYYNLGDFNLAIKEYGKAIVIFEFKINGYVY